MIPADFDFQVRAPDAPLNRFVECVWFAQGVPPHGEERILPSASPVILFVLGPPLLLTPPQVRAEAISCSGAWVQGPHDKPILNEPSGQTHAGGVVFRPGGLAPFLRRPVSSLTNRIVPLGELGDPFGHSTTWLDSLRATSSDRALDYLISWVEEVAPIDHAVDPWDSAIRALSTGTAGTVAELQNALSVSRRHFADRVKARVGLTPKVLLRIARLRRFLDELDARRPIRWSFEAVGAGYFDQPHAIRDFRAFTGLTPTEYIERRRAAWGTDIPPGEATNFVPERPE